MSGERSSDVTATDRRGDGGMASLAEHPRTDDGERTAREREQRLAGNGSDSAAEPTTAPR